MRRISTRLAGPTLLEPTVHRDDRGFFLESYRAAGVAHHGIDGPFVQDNHSRSTRGVVRGMHFATDPGQAKLVRVARGAIFDVVVDLRSASDTYGAWESFELDDVAHRMLYVPIGFAHGFQVLSDVADVLYKCSSYYDAARERTLAYDDAAVGIRWPLEAVAVSGRDRRGGTLHDFRVDGPRLRADGGG
jgi:dTDP-4-dehydrorhamnose 3,5-epimerase